MQTRVAEGCLLDISLAIDCSGSIREHNPEGVDNWQYVIDFIVSLVSSLNVEKTAIHVAAVSFGTRLQLCFHFVAVI